VLHVLVKRRTPHPAASSAVAAGALALALILMPMARAEERRITLDDAVKLALENNSLIKFSFIEGAGSGSKTDSSSIELFSTSDK